MDATAQAELVRTGEVSPAELVEAAIGRIEALNPQLNAVIHELFERGRARPPRGDLPDGPFKGVPFLFKDLGAAYAGQPLHLGMKLLKDADFRAPVDTYAGPALPRRRVRRRSARRTRPSSGSCRPPSPRPTARAATRGTPRRTTGGSSGGSGGRGRLRDGPDRPRQRRRRLDPDPGHGQRPRRPEADPPADLRGAAGRRHDDRDDHRARRLALRPRHGGDSRRRRGLGAGRPLRRAAAAAPLRGGAHAGRKLRIGFALHPPVPGLESDPECVAAVEAAAKLLESLGHAVEDNSPIDPAQAEALNLEDSFMTRWAAGQAAALDQLGVLIGREVTADDVEPLTWALAEVGRERSSARYLRRPRPAPARRPRHRRLARGRLRPAHDADDGRAAGATGHLRPARRRPVGRLRRATPAGAFTAIFNATGQPAISCRCTGPRTGCPSGSSSWRRSGARTC